MGGSQEESIVRCVQGRRKTNAGEVLVGAEGGATKAAMGRKMLWQGTKGGKRPFGEKSTSAGGTGRLMKQTGEL